MLCLLQVDQAALTGESLPVKKVAGDVAFSGSAIKQARRAATSIFPPGSLHTDGCNCACRVDTACNVPCKGSVQVLPGALSQRTAVC